MIFHSPLLFMPRVMVELLLFPAVVAQSVFTEVVSITRLPVAVPVVLPLPALLFTCAVTS
ncbi:Uncharacterised protein [Enterobacter cloacae]|nr:Uncharacterised protein [Enterobacter cloacae]